MKNYDQSRQHIKKQRHYFANKGPSSQSCGFTNSHVWMWELDYNGSWALKDWCFWTVVLETTLESPLDCKEIQPVHSEEGGQSTGVSTLASFLSKNTQDWSPLNGLVGSPGSPRDSQESSPKAQFKSINSSELSFLYSPTLTSIRDYWKNYSSD